MPQEKNLKEIFFKFFQYWHFMVLSILFCIFLAFVHLRYFTFPVYIISSTLLIKENESNLFSSNVSGGFGPINKNLGNEMIILKSTNLMSRVLAESGLSTSYFIEGKFNEIEVYEGDLPISIIVQELNSAAFGKNLKIKFISNNQFKLIEINDNNSIENTYRLGQQIIKNYASFTVLGSSDLNNPPEIIFRFNDVKNLARHYSNNLTISLESEKSNVLRLSLRDNIPQRSINILNKLVEVYNKEAIEDKSQVELSTIAFLDERIQFLSTELSDVEKDVELYKKDNLLVNVESNAQMYMQAASEYSKDLVGIELQLEIFQSIEDYVSQDELKLIPNSLNTANPTLISLIGKFNELQLERQKMLRTVQPGSAMIQNLDDQLNNLKFNIRENLRIIKNELTLTRNNLKSSSVQYQSKIRSVPSIERELLEINRQQGIKQAIYLFLLQKREEAGLSLASTSPISRTIDPATSTDFPINNNKKTIYFLAIFAGLLIPIGIIYIKDLLNDKITDRKDVEKFSDIPILGEIAHYENNEALQIFANRNTIITENFRLIRANLHFCNIKKENKVILITSCKSGEGKTSFTLNLGASLALTGKKVVVLSFDLRNPTLTEMLHLNKKQGIADYIITPKLEVNSIINSISQVDGLYSIGAGSKIFNPAELMMSERVELLLNDLKERFDKILIDTSPIGQVADAFTLGALSDSSILLVRYNHTTKIQLEYLEDLFIEKKLNQPMLVLNDAKKKFGSVYGYGYNGAYGNNDNKIDKIEIFTKNSNN